MEKLLRKTEINQSLRLLLIIASFVFGSSANVWAEDTVVDFSNGLPNDWTKNGTVQKQNYASANCIQLQANATIQSPAYTTAFESMKLNIARSKKGTTMTLSYQIGTNAAIDIETFSLGSSGKFSEQIVTLPAAAQVSGVKFILKSAASSYYVSKITLTPKTTSGGGTPAPPSYNITAPTYYKKITSTDELAAGGTYLIVCEGAKKALSATVSTVDYTQGENKTVTNETAATLGEFELIGTDENYKGAPLYEFLVDNKYLSGTTSTTISLATSVSDKTKWMIGFDKNGNVEIDSYSTFSVSDTNRGLIYQNSGKVIKHYAVSNRGVSGYSNVQLYQKVTDLAISTLTNGYATFVTDVPYAMPKGTCGYAVIVAPHVGVITKTEAYTEGSQVPAQTALLIGGAPGTNYYPAVLKENVAATYSGENYMEGRRTADGYTSSLRGVDVYYYKLALNSKSKPGFYYGAADGAAFQLTKPTTAYLAVPKNITPVNGYLIDFEGEETGISTIAPTNGNADGAIYNLNGIRMTQTLRNLPKGVYIVNGKKVIK